jgi:hypothetical protein
MTEIKIGMKINEKDLEQYKVAKISKGLYNSYSLFLKIKSAKDKVPGEIEQ